MKKGSHTNSPLFLWGWILFVTFGIVYTLFFSLAPNKDVFATQGQKNEQKETIVWPSQETIVRFQVEQNSAWTQLRSDDKNDSWEEQALLLPRTPKHIVSTQELFFGKPQTASVKNTPVQYSAESVLWSDYPGMLSFPGTHHWRWTMKSASFIWFVDSIKYVLKNNDNTHFAYLWNDLPDISESVLQLNWKTVAFTDKKDINTHWLFGDKIIFLQIPQYLGKKQLFFVYFSEERDRWFIQVDNDIFETTKPLLRELYAKRYNR